MKSLCPSLGLFLIDTTIKWGQLDLAMHTNSKSMLFHCPISAVLLWSLFLESHLYNDG